MTFSCLVLYGGLAGCIFTAWRRNLDKWIPALDDDLGYKMTFWTSPVRAQVISGLVTGKGALAADTGQLDKCKGYHEQPQLDALGG